MKKYVSLMLILLMAVMVTFTGCGKKTENDDVKDSGKSQQTDTKNDSGSTNEKDLKVVLLVERLGDKSFFDSANSGMRLIREKHGADTKVIEIGSDQTVWEPTLRDISEEDWDLIIVGTWSMLEPLSRVAADFSDQKYIVFDVAADYSDGKNANVYSVTYNYREGTFLGGIIAANLIDGNEFGYLGAKDIPVINEHMVGIVQGARYANPNIKVRVSYIGSFADTARAKEMALGMYNNNIDLIVNGAALAGIGIMEAADDVDKLVLGSDADQAAVFESTDPGISSQIPVSIMKRVDLSLLRAVDMYVDGKLQFGTEDNLGLSEGAIDISRNENYEKMVPDEVKNQVEEVRQLIIDGEIVVESSIGMSQEQLDELRGY